MSLSRKIAAGVEMLADRQVLPAAVTAEDAGHALTVEVAVAGPVGLESNYVEFVAGPRPSWTLPELQAWGDRLAARVTYLMEPLRVLEADPVGVRVLLRSQAPTPRAGRKAYYEVALDGRGVCRIERVVVDESTRRREPGTMQMTVEVLERLADDLVASLG